jgi:hypothetical protein
MNPKVKSLAWTGGALVVALLCAYVAWTSAADQARLLALFLKIIAFLFGLTALAAAGCLAWIARASEEMLAKPKKAAVSGTASGGTAAPSDFAFDPEAVEPAGAPASPKQGGKPPRPAKKTPRPARKPRE